MSNDWQSVDEKGLLKRYPIEGGYVYAAFDWTHESGLREGGYWRMVNAFFVATVQSQWTTDRANTRGQQNMRALGQ
jgi:hypothetical protein